MCERYIKSVNAGLLKIMSKMGISVLSSYRGGCNFETVGLSRTLLLIIFQVCIKNFWNWINRNRKKNTRNTQRSI
jgi:glutamate synthase domain-containing protein 2